MTPETYAILGVGITLAGLILNGQRAVAELRRELGNLSDRTSKDAAGLREHMEREIAALRERMAHLEGLLKGLLKGLREAIVGKAA